MSEEGRCDRELMRRGILQTHRVRQGVLYRGCGDFQIYGVDVGPVRQGLAGGPPEYQEGAPILEPDRETSKERGGGPASVRNFLSDSGAVGVTIWVGYLDFFDNNSQEAGGGTRGFPQKGDGS